MIGLTRALAIEYAERNIRVNAIAPRYIGTEIVERIFADAPDPTALRRETDALHPVKRIGRPEEIAWAAVFLASDEARFMRAECLVIEAAAPRCFTRDIEAGNEPHVHRHSTRKGTVMRAMRLISAIALSVWFGAATAAAQSVDLRDVWQGQSGAFANAARRGAGFSFRYNGTTVGPELSNEWQRAVTQDTKSHLTRTMLTHKSGLVVTREMRVMPAFHAVEYKLSFKNTARTTLPPVSDIQALNLSFGEAVLDGNCVVASGGGVIDGFLPPRSFAIRKHCFTSVEGSVVDLTTTGGRSSGKDLPFFFIHNDTRQEGMFVAFGWSGHWAAFAAHNQPPGTLSVWGKIPELEIALEPGEEIHGPTVLVGLYQGALSDGSNRLRRLIREVYTPKLAGRRFLPVVTYDRWWDKIGDNFDESLLKRLADGAAAIQQEYFLLDAGWYAGASWLTSVGNWEQVNPVRLPNGLKPVADYVRSKGMKFGLWFEPERVAPGTQLAKAHPEWILWDHGNEPAPWLSHVAWVRDLYPDAVNPRHGLLDYGRPEVQHWVRNLLDHYIREYGVQYIRYDFNLDPLPYWKANDKPHRRGMTQLRHIQGFYAVIDWLRERHPEVVLEGCASGGHRIDLETVRRFHTSLINDHPFDPSVNRFHLSGINYFLPGNYHYIPYTLPSSNQQDFHPDDLGFQSLFGGAFGTGGRVDLWPEPMRQQARRHVAIYKQLRRYVVEDYYPLGPQPGDLTSWSGWQFHDPADHSGFIQTFRTHTPGATHRFVLHKLEARARYRFTDAYSTQAFEVTGSAATTKGIEVTQAPMSSRVFTYRKVSN